MRSPRARTGLGVVVATILLVAGCKAPPRVAPRLRAYPTERIESELERGVSTRADVQRVLGRPNGAGALRLPGMAEVRDAWFYQQTRLAATPEPGREQPWESQTDVVLVFFAGERFDGFVYFSDADGTW